MPMSYQWLIVGVLFGATTCPAWTIGAKGHVIGPAIHTTYFLTPNNAAFKVNAQALVGYWQNGYCRYYAIYPLGTEKLQSGDFIDIDGLQLQSIAGGGYDCLSIYYTYHQLTIESFRLIWDGLHYHSSFPPVAQVTII